MEKLRYTIQKPILSEVLMILFVDETENDTYFIVTGLLVNSREDVNNAYRKFKKRIAGSHLSGKDKQLVYTEFKATQLDKHFQRIKKKLLEEIFSFENAIIYSCYIKKDTGFAQVEKERVYISLLSKIVDSLEVNADIVFDAFNKPDFEERVIQEIQAHTNVISVTPMDSRKEAGLQFVDNLCSVIRLYRSNADVNHFYDIIETRVKNI